MKPIILLPALVALALGGTALAGHGPGRGGHGDHFEKLDANKDGALTADEIEKGRESMFREADADGNGRLTKEEMRDFHKKEMGARMGDANGDGFISRKEFDDRHDEMFKTLDKNGDGKLSEEELRDHPRRSGERDR
jgi:Ca2+-binding EF-hand superfamily protein